MKRPTWRVVRWFVRSVIVFDVCQSKGNLWRRNMPSGGRVYATPSADYVMNFFTNGSTYIEAAGSFSVSVFDKTYEILKIGLCFESESKPSIFIDVFRKRFIQVTLVCLASTDPFSGFRQRW
jgi:hypothetical protein